MSRWSMPPSSARASATRLLPLASALLLVAACDELGEVSTLSASLAVSPTALVVDPLWAGYPHTSTVTVTNTGSAPLGGLTAAIADAQGAARFEATLHDDAVNPGNTIALDVTLRADANGSGPASASVVIDAGADGTLHVDVIANVRTPPSCDDANPCTSDSFDAALGRCLHDTRDDGSPCDDGSACTSGDACLEGRCLGAAVTCQDDQACTADVCDPSVGCVFEPIASRCDDEDPCTADVCAPFEGCSNPPLEEGALCHFDGCNEIGLCFVGQCVLSEVPDGMPCEDGDACTANDTCQSGECASGPELGVGAAPPFSFSYSGIGVDLCAGPTTGSDCYSAFPGEVGIERVLAVDRQGDLLRFVWQGAYLDTWGALCDPTDLQYQTSNLDPPDDEQPPPPLQDAGPGAPEGPGGGAMPATMVCAAGVYLTSQDLGPLASAGSTTQLTAVRGPAAAAFPTATSTSTSADRAPEAGDPAEPPPPLPSSADVVIAHPGFLRSSVWIEERHEDGTLVRSFERTPDANAAPFVGRLAHLGVAADEQLITVVAHADELELPADVCDGPGCDRINVPLWIVEQPRFDVDGLGRVLQLQRMRDEHCAGVDAGTVPLAVHELSVFPTHPQTIALRMSRSACGDLPSASTSETAGAAPQQLGWHFTLGPWSVFPVVVPPLESLAVGSDGAESFGSFRTTADGGGAALRHIPVPCECAECLDPDEDPTLECACVPAPGTCFDTVVERTSDVVYAVPEPLLRSEGVRLEGQTVPLIAEGELRVVTLLGNHVELLGTDENGVLSRIVAPSAMPRTWDLEAPLLAGPPESLTVVGSGFALGESQSLLAMVQVFGCGLGGALEDDACLEDVDCDEGLGCDRSVCLPGPDCAASGTCDLCWGRCTEVGAPSDDGGVPDGGADSDGGVHDGGPLGDAAAPEDDSGSPDGG